MKQLINLVFLFFSLFFYAQNYPFATEFTSGKVILKDSSEISGQIKWYPSQNDKLRFKKNENENYKYRYFRHMVNPNTDPEN